MAPSYPSQPGPASAAMSPATSNGSGSAAGATLGSVHVPGLGGPTGVAEASATSPSASHTNSPHMAGTSGLMTSSSGNTSEPFARSSTLGPGAGAPHTTQLQHHLQNHLSQHQHALPSHHSSSSAASSSAGHGALAAAASAAVSDPHSNAVRLNHKDSFGGPGLAFALAGGGTSASGGAAPPLPTGSASLSRSGSGAFSSAHGSGSHIDQPPGAFNEAIEVLGGEGVSRSGSGSALRGGNPGGSRPTRQDSGSLGGLSNTGAGSSTDADFSHAMLGGTRGGRQDDVDGDAENEMEGDNDDAEFQEALDDTSLMSSAGTSGTMDPNTTFSRAGPPQSSAQAAPLAVSTSGPRIADGSASQPGDGLLGSGTSQGDAAQPPVSPFGRTSSISGPSGAPPQAPPRSPARERAGGRGFVDGGSEATTPGAALHYQQTSAADRGVPRVKVATAGPSSANGGGGDSALQGYDDASEAATSSATLTSASQVGRIAAQSQGQGGGETFDSAVTRRGAGGERVGSGATISAGGATHRVASRATSGSNLASGVVGAGSAAASAVASRSSSSKVDSQGRAGSSTASGKAASSSTGATTSAGRTLAPPTSSRSQGGSGAAGGSTSRYGSSNNASGSSLSLRSPGHRAALPSLPMAPNMKPAPPPAMYWSKAPVHGNAPKRSFRAHTAELADEVLWIFGGCDQKGCFRDLWCFDTETMCWSRPKVSGDIPPPRRAHSATMVDGRMFVFAGGDGPSYYNDLYIFDTVSLRWTKPETYGAAPSPRRAHTSNYHNGQLIIFGGGNGVGALNDVHALDIGDTNRLEWRKLECGGKVPIGRGYHTANLVDGKLIVIGGSDGHMSFNDIHILKLDTRVWYQVKTDEIHNRLGHTATQVGSYLFIIGGHDGQRYTPEILTLNLVNLQWEPRRVCGKKPPGRGYHQAWLRDSRLFIHGGFDGKDIVDELFFIDLAACAYLPQITSFGIDLVDEGEEEEGSF